jgi:hypothetical protein
MDDEYLNLSIHVFKTFYSRLRVRFTRTDKLPVNKKLLQNRQHAYGNTKQIL